MGAVLRPLFFFHRPHTPRSTDPSSNNIMRRLVARMTRDRSDHSRQTRSSGGATSSPAPTPCVAGPLPLLVVTPGSDESLPVPVPVPVLAAPVAALSHSKAVRLQEPVLSLGDMDEATTETGPVRHCYSEGACSVRYRISGVLGEGSQGSVHSCEDLELGITVALKRSARCSTNFGFNTPNIVGEATIVRTVHERSVDLGLFDNSANLPNSGLADALLVKRSHVVRVLADGIETSRDAVAFAPGWEATDDFA